MAGGRVAHVHDPDGPVRVDRDPPEQEAAHQPRGREQVIRGAQAHRRVHAHDRQALGRHTHGLHLGLVNRVHVRDAEPRRAELLRLGGGLARRGRPERRGARCVDHPLDTRAQALLHHGPRAINVHVEEELGVLGPHGRDPRAVEHPRHPAHRPPHRAPVADLELHPPTVEACDRRVRRAVLHPERHVVSALGQKPGHVRSDEAGGAGYEDVWQGRRV
jgi:hypothetical protein